MSRRRGPGLRALVAAGLVVTLVVAGLAGLYASGSPDGLERAAIDHGLTREQDAHQLDDSPLAGYQTSGVDGALSGGLAALAGIGVTFVLAAAVVRLLRRGTRPAAPTARSSGPARAPGTRRPADRQGPDLRPHARPGDHAVGPSAGEDA